MPTPTTVRRILPAKKRNFGRISDEFPVPDLTQIQTRSYERFLQADLSVDKRGDAGLEGVFREIFPIESYDKTLKLNTFTTTWASRATTPTSAGSSA